MFAYKYLTIILIFSAHAVEDRGPRPSINSTTFLEHISDVLDNLMDFTGRENTINITIHNNRNDSHAIEHSKHLEHNYEYSDESTRTRISNGEKHGIPLPESSALLLTLSFLIVGFSIVNLAFTVFLIVEFHKARRYSHAPENERLDIVSNDSENQSWTV